MLSAGQDHPTVVWDIGNVLIPWDRSAALLRATGDPVEARRLAESVFTMELNDVLDAGDDLDEVLESCERISPGSATVVESYVRHFGHSLGPADPHCRAILEELQGAGVRCVGLSNFSAITFEGVPQRYPVLGLLESILISGEVGVTKPHERIFELCESRFGLDPLSIVFIDDNPDNTSAAAARGWDAVTFRGAERLRRELASRGLPVEPTPPGAASRGPR